MQELNHEEHLGSKSITLNDSRELLSFKVLIEQMREQIKISNN